MVNFIMLLATLILILKGQVNDLLLVVIIILSIGIINIKGISFNLSSKIKAEKLPILALLNGVLVLIIYGLIVVVMSNNNWMQKDVLYPESINSIRIVLDLLALSIIIICMIFKFSNKKAKT